MVAYLLDSTGDILGTQMDECCHILYTSGEDPIVRRGGGLVIRLVMQFSDILLFPLRLAVGDSCRSFKELFMEIRKRASKALGFAKMLRKVGWYTTVHYIIHYSEL